MTLMDFAHKLNSASARSNITALLCEFINEHSEQYNERDIKNFVSGLREDQTTSFGNKLGYCRNYCLEEANKEGNKNEKDYLEKLEKTAALLETMSKVYQATIEAKRAVTVNNSDSALLQQKQVLLEINENVKIYKREVDESREELKRISTSLNDKIFSVLINTVSLLGIFVTIAFAGFGVASVFSNVNLDVALRSEEAFVKNIFYILLTALLSYNLLLLLVYFIYKLSRPLNDLNDLRNSSVHQRRRVVSFSQSISLKAFLWIDGILALVTIAALVACICCW